MASRPREQRVTIPPPTAEEVIEASPFAALTESVIGAAIEVHRHLGPGLTEAPYREALELELLARGHAVERERFVPVFYKSRQLKSHYRLDLLVDGVLIIETKGVSALNEQHRAQTLSYLKATKLPVALLINFHAPTLKAGLARLINWAPSTSP
jgi:GxxExxY protein